MKRKIAALAILPVFVIAWFSIVNTSDRLSSVSLLSFMAKNGAIFEIGSKLSLAIEFELTQKVLVRCGFKSGPKSAPTSVPMAFFDSSQTDKYLEEFQKAVVQGSLPQEQRLLVIGLTEQLKQVRHSDSSIQDYYNFEEKVHSIFAAISSAPTTRGFGKIFNSIGLVAEAGQELMLSVIHFLNTAENCNGQAMDRDADHSILEHIPIIFTIKSKYLILSEPVRNSLKTLTQESDWLRFNRFASEVMATERGIRAKLSTKEINESIETALLIRNHIQQALLLQISELNSKLSRDIQEEWKRTLSSLLLVLLISLVVLGLGFFLSRNLSLAITELETFAHEISVGHYQFRIQSARKDELGNLGRNLDHMADKIEQQNKTIALQTKFSALGEMAGGIAHEINTPLAAISVNAENILDALSEDSMDKTVLSEIATDTLALVRRIGSVVRSLRTFSRSGEQEIHQYVKIETLLEDTLSLCRERFRNNGLLLKVSEINKTWEVHCNPIQISQVLLNLLNNAFDATKGSKNAWVELTVKLEAESFRFSVTDSGKGIPIEMQTKLFTPFYTTKPIGSGTGLGLSIARGIAEQHKGTLFYDSGCPHTCFVLVLPHDRSIQDGVEPQNGANDKIVE